MTFRTLCLLCACASTVAAAGLQVTDGQLRAGGVPVALRALAYPLAARHDGRPFDPAALCQMARMADLNALFVTVAEGPSLAAARRLASAAAEHGLWFAVQPLPAGDLAGSVRIRSALGREPDLWVAAQLGEHGGLQVVPAGEQPPQPGTADLLLGVVSSLFQPAQSFADWGRRLSRLREAFGGPTLANVEVAPPDWFVHQQVLQSASPQPDLYRDARYRPETAARLGGEYLLVPDPAQIRLASYAALANGARGVVFDQAGHLCGGTAPYDGTDRLLEVRQLGRELRRVERFMAAGTVLPAPETPPGVSAGVLQHQGEWLVVLQRDRRLDTRSVGGRLTPALELDLPLDPPDGLRIVAIEPGRLVPQPLDLRPNGLRLSVPPFALTRLYLLTTQPFEPLAAELSDGFPEVAEWSLREAVSHYQKVAATLQRLEVAGKSYGGGLLLRRARDELSLAALALGQGYHQSGWETVEAAARSTRSAQALELESVLVTGEAEARPSQALTFAALPWLHERRAQPPTLPYAVTPDKPCRIGFDELTAGEIPPRWRALRGFDQTVETLRATPDGAEQTPLALRWTPTGGDPGAIGLPFSSMPALSLSFKLRLAGPPRGARLLLLAPAPETAPLAGVVIGADGKLTTWPQPSAGQPVADGAWHPVAFQWQAGRLSVSLDGQRLGEVAGTAAADAGALLLAKYAGSDDVPLDLDEVRISVR